MGKDGHHIITIKKPMTAAQLSAPSLNRMDSASELPISKQPSACALKSEEDVESSVLEPIEQRQSRIRREFEEALPKNYINTLQYDVGSIASCIEPHCNLIGNWRCNTCSSGKRRFSVCTTY